MSPEQAIHNFISYLQTEKRYSVHTALAYKKDLEQFCVFFSLISEDTTVESIKFHHVRSWMVSLKSDGLEARSINRKISVLRNYFKFLKRQIPKLANPCDKVKALKQKKRLPQIIRKDDFLRLRESIIKNENDFIQYRDYLILELFYSSGIRRSELIGLRLKDIDLSLARIRVLGKGNKERIIPIPKMVLIDISQYLEMRKNISNLYHEELFLTKNNKPLYPKAVYNIVKKYLTLLTTLDKRSPHILRHSYATHLMDEGAEINAVKELLGHSSLLATQVYTHNSIESLKEIYKNAHPKGT